MEEGEEKIVMTPKKPKAARSTRLKIERRLMPNQSTNGNGKPKVHVAGGNYAGIVINKQQEDEDPADELPPNLCLEFRVYLKSQSTQMYVQERRVIGFWFKPRLGTANHAFEAQEFFKKLVAPTDFPRDYVGFMKKVMKLMQVDHPLVAKVELELTQEREMDRLPIRPSDFRKPSRVHPDDDEDGRSSTTSVGQNDVLGAIEEAYPNSLTIDDMAKRFRTEKEMVRHLVLELVEKNMVKPVGGAGVPAGLPGTVDSATGAFRRVHHREDEENVTVVKQMPCKSSDNSLRPTIAIITAQYFEKTAVDAVMTNRRTFVRYATNGEANVYTLGHIGDHLVVSTKLPMTGRTRDALIATGGTTTRLLGTFQDIEKVFLVGVGGGVPHYTDFDQHVRLGDVVLSAPSEDKSNKFIYQYYENVSTQKNVETMKFEMKSWCPDDLVLQEIGRNLVADQSSNMPWLGNYEAISESLTADSETSWSRPDVDSDKLYMAIGDNTLIEVGHPSPKNGQEDPRLFGRPVLHVGPVATGRHVALDDRLRQDFSSRNSIKAFDSELDPVVDSIYGSRKDSYMLIRGISDYKDGSKGTKDWQQYSALMAASVLKAIIDEIPN